MKPFRIRKRIIHRDIKNPLKYPQGPFLLSGLCCKHKHRRKKVVPCISVPILKAKVWQDNGGWEWRVFN